MTGHLGTRQARADCPRCGRDTAGGYWNTNRTKIILHKHKPLGHRHPGAPWCPGGDQVVDVQRNSLELGGRG